MNKIIQICISEVNCDDNWTPIESRECPITHRLPGELLKVIDKHGGIKYELEQSWESLKNYFLENEDSIPFRKIRRDDENNSKN